ncbi:MAG: TIGR02147 family protein [Fibrobacteria bacterium]|nr:TIGR02147 family protein [Fibrobacteria bacterium]
MTDSDKINVFDYDDYRVFLRDKYQELKKKYPWFIYSYVAHRAGFKSPGFFTQILQSKSNLSERLAKGLAPVFELENREVKYFRLLVNYNQASKHKEREYYLEKIQNFKRLNVFQIDPDKFEFFSCWYYPAVRAALHYYSFDGDYVKLGKLLNPSITASQAKRAVALLKKLKLIEKTEDGSYTLTDVHISTGKNANNAYLDRFVLNTLDISKNALHKFPRDKRKFTVLTASLSSEGYKQIAERVDRFREEVAEIVRQDSEIDRVYQMNIQLFPLSALDDKPGDEK